MSEPTATPVPEVPNMITTEPTAPATTEPTPTPTTTTTEPVTTLVSTSMELNDMPQWMNDLPDQYKSSASLAKYQTMDSFLDGHEQLSKKMGEKFEAPQNEDPDAWNEWYDRTGRPKSAKDYSVIEDLPFDAAALDSTQQAMHDMGLSDRQYKAMMEMYKGSVEHAESASEAAAELASTEATAEAVSTLKKEWGGDFETNVKIANQTLQKFGIAEQLVELGLGNSSLAIKMGLALAQQTGETMLNTDGISGSVGNFAEQVQALKEQPAFRDVTHANHKAICDKIVELYSRQHR